MARKSNRWIAHFSTHSARGLVRDQRTRRKTMFVVVLGALLLVFAGSTFLQAPLDPHEHLLWFILYWLACAWLTLLAILLALFDLLMVRADGRARRKQLRTPMEDDSPPVDQDDG